MTRQGDVIQVIDGAGTLAQVEADPYQAALLTWLEGKPDNTRAAYFSALRDFMKFLAELPAELPADGQPRHWRQVTPLDVAGWKEDLKRRGLADTTIAQRLSALSSFYSYLQRPQADGQPIQAVNPVDGVGRDDLEVSPYERARPVSAEDFRAILDVIDADTVTGARDRALFLFYVLCGRRRSEVLRLRGRDLRIEAGQAVTYRVRLKRGKVKWKQLPPPVWAAIQRYLELAGRTLQDNSPLFVATVDNGRYLRRHYNAPPLQEEQPITGEAVAQALDRYARRAGLDPQAVTLHSLRHLGARLFKDAAGGDVVQTQMFLDHANLATTQIYVQQLEGEKHAHWQAMANALEV